MANDVRRICVRLFLSHKRFQKITFRAFSTPSLVEVGKLEKPKDSCDKYEIGQLFLHKNFGYRGIILYPWQPTVYESETIKHSKSDKKSSTKKTYYYEVLIDKRDSSSDYIKDRLHTEAVSILLKMGSKSSNNVIPGVHVISGSDYVSHDDVLPYRGTDEQPIHHDFCNEFLTFQADLSPQYVPTEIWNTWQSHYHQRLQLHKVYISATNDIRVTVIPFYIGEQKIQGKNTYWWRYFVRLENLGSETVQLIYRKWNISSPKSSNLDITHGRGVVGKEPILSPDLPFFQYSSHVHLQTPDGHMWGTFKMKRLDGSGSEFECNIPMFTLEGMTKKESIEALTIES